MGRSIDRSTSRIIELAIDFSNDKSEDHPLVLPTKQKVVCQDIHAEGYTGKSREEVQTALITSGLQSHHSFAAELKVEELSCLLAYGPKAGQGVFL